LLTFAIVVLARLKVKDTQHDSPLDQTYQFEVSLFVEALGEMMNVSSLPLNDLMLL